MIKKPKYNSLIEWKNAEPKAYKQACIRKKGDERLIDIICKKNKWKPIEKRTRWTPKLCVLDAQKYEYKRDWKKKNETAFEWAKKFNIIEECTKHMKKTPRGMSKIFSKDLCEEHSKLYKNRVEWRRSIHSNTYYAAVRHKWIDEFMSKEKKGRKFEINKEFLKQKCIKIALTYRNRREWKNGHPKTYYACKNYNWHSDCKHKKNNDIIV
jgi:hypothetical protein